ncbi:hypothetical protein [Roseinatronobacter sp. NSM]|uniref:hypothetical protein n=1 Tax=Roseinatronobacter sp. NSM TaxID=3457785 RepID=UPI0040359E17
MVGNEQALAQAGACSVFRGNPDLATSCRLLLGARKYLICINAARRIYGKAHPSPGLQGCVGLRSCSRVLLKADATSFPRKNNVVLRQIVKRCIAEVFFDSSQGLFWWRM